MPKKAGKNLGTETDCDLGSLHMQIERERAVLRTSGLFRMEILQEARLTHLPNGTWTAKNNGQ